MVKLCAWLVRQVLGIVLVVIFAYIAAMLILPLDPSIWPWLALLVGLLALIIRLGDAFRGR